MDAFATYHQSHGSSVSCKRPSRTALPAENPFYLLPKNITGQTPDNCLVASSLNFSLPDYCIPATRNTEVGTGCRTRAARNTEVGTGCRIRAARNNGVGTGCRTRAARNNGEGTGCRARAATNTEAFTDCGKLTTDITAGFPFSLPTALMGHKGKIPDHFQFLGSN